MAIGTRHCVEYNFDSLPGLDLPQRADNSWFPVRAHLSLFVVNATL